MRTKGCGSSRRPRSTAARLPKVRVAYSSEGLIFNVDVYDAKHEQPYAQERLMEGDAVTVAVDVDRGLDW